MDLVVVDAVTLSKIKPALRDSKLSLPIVKFLIKEFLVQRFKEIGLPMGLH